MANACVLDTNIISYVLEKHEKTSQRLREAMRQRVRLYLCPVVLFEVRRGFIHKPQPRKSQAFDVLAKLLYWDDLSREDWEHAAELWGMCESSGRHRKDADILIAAFAATRGAVLVTADEGHFSDLGLSIENWRRQ